MKQVMAVLGIIIFRLIMAFPAAYMLAWSCDTLFDTMLMDYYWCLYLTLAVTIPLVKITL